MQSYLQRFSRLRATTTMPKVTSRYPLSGIFAVAKPSGPTSMSLVNDVKRHVVGSRLFVEEAKLKSTQGPGTSRRKSKYGREAVKIGQGGTLDPLADGVLVIGVGKGTKKLTEFLDCVKVLGEFPYDVDVFMAWIQEYRTTCLLGCETDSYDSEGAQVRLAPWKHVTKEQVEKALEPFRGEIYQTPPIFSALKMDGKPLYEYAREGIPLPRPIEKRKVTIHSIELVEWKGGDHSFRYPEKKFTAEQQKAVETALKGVEENTTVQDNPEPDTDPEAVPTAFIIKMKVSGGTYVRSVVHELGHALGSAAHVVTLTRTRQGRFALEPSEGDYGCVPWEVFVKANTDPGEADEDGWREWEREVMERLDVIEDKKTHLEAKT